MGGKTDMSRPDMVIAGTLNANGNLVTPGQTAEPFAHQFLQGYNAFSLTLQTLPGNTSSGTVFVQCTDLLKNRGIFASDVGWVDMNYPNTNTPVSISVGGANTYNIQVYGVACSYIRLRFAYTSGSGTINVGITCRANSR